jgi:hypothetical protein
VPENRSEWERFRRSREPLRAVPDLTPEQRAAQAQADLDAVRERIRKGAAEAERLANPPRERWFRRLWRRVQSNRTAPR